MRAHGNIDPVARRMVIWLAVIQVGWAGRPTGVDGQPGETSRTFRILRVTETRQPVRWWAATGKTPLAPRLARFERELEFYDRAGEAVNLVAVPAHAWLTTDRGVGFVAVAHISAADRDAALAGRLSVDVFDSFGTRRARIVRPWGMDEPRPTVAVSPADGSLTLGNAVSGELGFYAPSGQPVTEVHLFESQNADPEKVLLAEFSADGQRLYILATHASRDGEASRRAVLIRMTGEGDEVWRRSFPETNAGQLLVSPSGRFVAVSVYGTLDGPSALRTRMLDERGEQIAETELLFRHGDFRPEETGLVLADRSRALSLELPGGSVKWEHQVSAPGEYIRTVAAAGEVTALLTSKWQLAEGGTFTDPRCLILGASGETIWERKFGRRSFDAPALWLAEDGSQGLVGFGDSWHLLERR